MLDREGRQLRVEVALDVPGFSQCPDEPLMRNVFVGVQHEYHWVQVTAACFVANSQEVVSLLADGLLQHLGRQRVGGAVAVVGSFCALYLPISRKEPLREVHQGLARNHGVAAAGQVLPEVEVVHQLSLELRRELPKAALDLVQALEQDMQSVELVGRGNALNVGGRVARRYVRDSWIWLQAS